MARLYKRNPTGPWWADYLDRHGDRQRRSTGCSDKASAKKILDKWKSEQKLMSLGLMQSGKGGEAIKPHLQAFQTTMFAAGLSRDYIVRTAQLIDNAVKFNEWTLLNQINAEGLARYLEHLKKDIGRAHRTLASVITAMRTFCKYLVRNRALLNDPTADLKKPSAKTDRRIERRMLLPEEWYWLKKTLLKHPVLRNSQRSDERLLLYWTAIETGLRASELMSLTKSALMLDSKEPHLIVRASITKNSELAKQYVSDELADKLRRAVSKKTPGAKVFRIGARTEMARALVADISHARSIWLLTKEGKANRESDFLSRLNSQQESIDFHSLRHTCGAWLVQAGVTLAEVKEIMRHSTITLTIDAYGHLAPDARSRRRSVLVEMLA
jgi:integrase